ncbi:hypothetical protein T4D_10507 [Trichinella pseudospiralis]|uniref:CCHC-type domain-containing protein n=1 Tax=Trichinella pseudospiralis TaxID=6337 RepID=A0A0V1FYR2_TRIPS|nr:hypothetical protein T4D_10507 [Trichinella pseudospiralis]
MVRVRVHILLSVLVLLARLLIVESSVKSPGTTLFSCHVRSGDPVLLITFWSSEPDRVRDSDLWIVYGTQRDVEGKLDSLGEEDLNRMCDESEKAVVIQGQLSLVETLFRETDALESAYEEALEAEEQEASMIKWSGYRLDFLRSQARAHEEPKIAEVERNVCLPRLELPKFDAWGVGCNEVGNLRGCLTGAARDTIEGLSASNQGYELALQRLRERFDRPMVAVREQILRLVDLLMTKNKLSTICDEFHKKVYALTALGKDPRTSDLSVAEVLIALCREQSTACSISLGRAGASEQCSGGERKRDSPESPPRGSATFLHVAVKRSCYICQKQHLPQQCPSLLRAGSRQRRELARRARSCFACLEPGHYASGCKHRGKTTDGKPVPASSPSPSASEGSAAEQKKIVRSEEPSSAHVHANVATSSSQWTSRLQTLRSVAYGEQDPGKRVTCLLDFRALVCQAGSRFRLGSRRTDQPIVSRRDRWNPTRDPGGTARETLAGPSRWQIGRTSSSSSFDDAKALQQSLQYSGTSASTGLDNR